MATDQPSGAGTLVIASLLIEAIVFAGMWIYAYATNTHPPWELLPWFGGATVLIIVVGLFLVLRAGGDQRD